MNVAYCDWRTPRCSRSSDFVKPSNSRLPPPSDDRRDDDRQLVDEPGLERLADDVGAAHDVDVLVAGGLASPADRLVDARDERERAALRLLLGPVRDDEERQAPRVLVAPVLGGLVRPAPADDRADPATSPRESHSASSPVASPLGLVVVRPRAAEDPVVQPLAALAEPLARVVVRAGDVAVDRRRDPCQHLCHRSSPFRGRVSEASSVETVAAPRTHRRPRAGCFRSPERGMSIGQFHGL